MKPRCALDININDSVDFIGIMASYLLISNFMLQWKYAYTTYLKLSKL